MALDRPTKGVEIWSRLEGGHESSDSNEAGLSRALDAWNAGNLAAYLELYDESIRLHGYAPQTMMKEEARGFYESILAAFANNRLTFHDVFSSGGKTCIRCTMSDPRR